MDLRPATGCGLHPAARRPQWQPAECCERNRRIFQQQWQYSDCVWWANAGWANPDFWRDRDRIAADHLRRDDAVHGRDDRSLHWWPRRYVGPGIERDTFRA